ncbi:hypothetical protein, conserved [Plasmodium gonderi]|uniref:Transporter n=1 Tax=Plasmodium gonderi TaxID=77519 RepID=A0A1Y1JEY0_PLAGO|nr:hypothetical protein, conserved [Plasmodium gonderi]GAW81091.1 hypothetical protein, conserved [Plasmodium gonderi]
MNMQCEDDPLQRRENIITKSHSENEKQKSNRKKYSNSKIEEVQGEDDSVYITQNDKDYVKFSNKNYTQENIDIHNNFFYDKNKKIRRTMPREEDNSSKQSTMSKMKKFFLIFFNGCLVVFLGVSNNICGRMRNRVLNNFDSLTASYNAIAYVIIYLVLCIIYSKSRSITKDHWLYIYPCLRKFFKKKGESAEIGKIDLRKEDKHNYTVDVKDEETIKRKKKITKIFYIHKKRIYEPLLEGNMEHIEDECFSRSTRNSDPKNGSECITGIISNSKKCDLNIIPNERTNTNERKRIQVQEDENKNICHNCTTIAGVANRGDKKRTNVYNGQNTNETRVNHHNERNNEEIDKSCSCNMNKDNFDEVEISSFSKQDIKDILENYKHYEPYEDIFHCRETKVNKIFSNIKNKWTKLGAYKYIGIIAILDIISNTLYFVSQLAIPLTILLLLNQLNFIFSILLSFLILKRKYNIHHVLSVIIVIVGFLFFYIPYVYKENTIVTKQILVNYYMNSNFTINLNHTIFDNNNHFTTLYHSSETTDTIAPPLGIFASIFFCVFSILLTSFGGILREIFFSEYIKQREKHHNVLSIRKSKKKCTQICSANCIPRVGTQQGVFDEMETEVRMSSEETNRQMDKTDYPKVGNIDEYNSFDKQNETDKNGYTMNLEIPNVSYKKEETDEEEAEEEGKGLQSGISTPERKGVSNKINSTENGVVFFCPKFRKEGGKMKVSKGADFSTSLALQNRVDPVDVEKGESKHEVLRITKGGSNMSDRMSVILLSFNTSLIQICLLPIIIYFQLLFNKNKDVSYLLYIEDSLQCFLGHTMENNTNCKYSFRVYSLYIIVNAIFNLSVSSFYRNYSSAECFLILKSSTPLTLVILYFYDFPFILDSDKYFTIYFVISIIIVFTGVSYFFYQNIASEKKNKVR